MKTMFRFILPLLAALAFHGCASETPQQQIATGIYAGGYAVSNDAMTTNASIIVQLGDVAAKLPLINTGKLTPNDLGVLSGELQNVAQQTTLLKGLFPADSSKLDSANAFIAGVISSNAALNGGRAPTADQVLATTALQDFSNGLTDGIQFWQGKHSVQKPAAPPSS